MTSARNESVKRTDSQGALVFAADEGYVRPTAVALHSALDHMPSELTPEICVLANAISDESRDRLQKVATSAAGHEIRWIAVPEEHLIDPRPELVARSFTSTAYSRLLIPDLLPATIRRAVYLDGDVIVRRDISPLFRVRLDGAPLAAVRDLYVWRTDTEFTGAGRFIGTRPYFNSGVLVMDVARWRGEGIGKGALAMAGSARESLPLADQDAMNVVVTNWRELDFRWNVQTTMYWDGIPCADQRDWLSRNRASLYRDAAIVHFVGFPKPWDNWSKGWSPGAMLWARALLRSGWYRPSDYVRWLLPWLGRRSVDALRRARARNAEDHA